MRSWAGRPPSRALGCSVRRRSRRCSTARRSAGGHRHRGARVRAAVPDRRTSADRPHAARAPARASRYTTFGVIGSTMSDGNITPLALDGMAAFPHPTDPNLVRLIRNHEDRNGTNLPVEPGHAGRGAVHLRPDRRRRLLDARLRPAHAARLVRDFISLKGTIINCAGGYSLDYQPLAHRRGGGQRPQRPPPRLRLPGPGHARAGRDAERRRRSSRWAASRTRR